MLSAIYVVWLKGKNIVTRFPREKNNGNNANLFKASLLNLKLI